MKGLLPTKIFYWLIATIVSVTLYVAVYQVNIKIQKLEKRVYELEYSMDKMTEFFNSDRSQLYK